MINFEMLCSTPHPRNVTGLSTHASPHRSALDAVVDTVRDEFIRLEKLIEQLLEDDPEGNAELVDQRLPASCFLPCLMCWK